MNFRKRHTKPNGVTITQGKQQHLTDNQCVICGKHTQSRATVYLGRQVADPDGRMHVDWQPYTRALCRACAEGTTDNERFSALVYMALQVCWVPLVIHGPSVLGIGGAAVAIYSLFRIVQIIGRWLWRRTHPADGRQNAQTPPAWLGHDESSDERASRALKALVSEGAAASQLALETLGEHRRRQN